MIISFHAAMNPLSLRTDNKYYDSSNIFARAQLVSTHHETEYPQSNWVISENIRYDKIGQKGWITKEGLRLNDRTIVTRDELTRLAQTFKYVSSRANDAYDYGVWDWQCFSKESHLILRYQP